MTDPQKVFEDLKAAMNGTVLSLEGAGDDGIVLVKQTEIRTALIKLKADGFNVLVDLTAADYKEFGRGAQPRTGSFARPVNPAPEGSRFKLTYRLLNLDPAEGLVRGRIAVQCWAQGSAGPASVRDLWPNADWLEREVWDMFGVSFSDRPDIKRILLYEEFVGHPLRKDYPINKRQPLIGPNEDKVRDRMTEGDLRPKVTE